MSFRSLWTAFGGFLVVLLGNAASLHAQGGPPLVTDDPGTPGDGHWEINVAWTREDRAGESIGKLPLLDLNYGLGDRIQLKYEGSLLVVGNGARPNHRGLSNSLVGIKWRFLDGEKNSIAVSTYPQFGFRNPGSSSARRGLVADENSWILPLEFQKDLGLIEANMDVGRVINTRSKDSWFFGCAVGHQFRPALEVVAEIHAETDGGWAQRSLLVDAGARVKLDARVTLLLSLGRELTNRREPRATVSYLGLQLSR